MKTKTQEEQEFLSTAIERFEKLESRDGHNRRTAKSDLEFVYNVGDGQWPANVRREREEENRPCLTSNVLRKHVAQVANRERDQRMAGNVRPVDSRGDIQTAQLISGIIRQIEHQSKASRIYTRAGEHAIAGSFGYWRITSEEIVDSFDQELFIREIKNQFAVRLDPDRMYGFIREKVRKDDFEFNWPDAEEEDFSDGQSSEEDEWYDDEHVYVAEYFYKEREERTIVQARNKLLDEVNIFELGKKVDGREVTEEMLVSQGWVIEKRKQPKEYKVKWAKITRNQVLEKGDWAGEEIPIVEVEGDWVNIDGKVYKRSLISDAKDDQRMYNYWLTNITEHVALAIKAPYMVTKQMIKGFEKFWKVAHKKLQPYLPFNPHGKLTPRREPPPQVPTGSAAMLQITKDNIQDSMGRSEASFGEKSNERTGVAIEKRASRSDFGSFHFEDNYRNAVLESTRMLVDLIQKVVDTDRVVRILGEDGPSDEQDGLAGKDKLIRVNYEMVDPESLEVVKVADLSVGKYDVVEDVKIMSTRRQESLHTLERIAAGSPHLAMVLAPYIMELQDMPYGIGKRVKQDIKEVLPAMLGINKPPGAGAAPGANPGA